MQAGYRQDAGRVQAGFRQAAYTSFFPQAAAPSPFPEGQQEVEHHPVPGVGST